MIVVGRPNYEAIAAPYVEEHDYDQSDRPDPPLNSLALSCLPRSWRSAALPTPLCRRGRTGSSCRTDALGSCTSRQLSGHENRRAARALA